MSVHPAFATRRRKLFSRNGAALGHADEAAVVVAGPKMEAAGDILGLGVVVGVVVRPERGSGSRARRCS